jgi:hypothetical protein
MSDQNAIITALLEERASAHNLRIKLIAHLRSSGDPLAGNAMIQAYLDVVGLVDTNRPNCIRYLPDLIALMKVLVPDWHIQQIHRVGDKYAVILEAIDGRSYHCKYVAENPMNPLIVSVITARLFDIGKTLDDFEDFITKS